VRRVGARISGSAHLACQAAAIFLFLAIASFHGLAPQALARDATGLNTPASSHSAAAATGTTRADEIQSCRPDELQTWGDGKDTPSATRRLVFHYQHSAQTFFTEQEVTQRIDQALEVWQQCGLSLTRMSPGDRGTQQPAGTRLVAIDWDAKAARIGIAVADLGRSRLSLNPQVFDLLLQRRDRNVALETLQMTLSHEIGHFFGMRAHSKRCVDVMSYYTDGQGNRCIIRDRAEFGKVLEYRSSLPTACDIERCRRLQGQPR
jgi:hypothetical protein